MNIFERNKFNIEKRISLGLNLLKKNYELKKIDTKDFEELHIQNMDYSVEQYEIKGVGNLVIMVCKYSKVLQMDSFVITPYYKNLPLFSTDYMYMREKRSILNEIYNLTDKKDNLYSKYISQFSKAGDMYKNLPDMPVKSCWYDEIRAVCIAKNTEIAHDEDIIKLFMKNLEIFINMEKDTPRLNRDQYKRKWQITKQYVERLIKDGGVSTDVFKAALGIDKTEEFFDEVFFAPQLYKK